MLKTCKYVKEVGVAQKGRIKNSELEELVDVLESSYMFEQPRPETVDIEDGYIHVRYDRLRRVAPLDQAYLFTSFAKLAAHGKPSDAKIKRWVGRFGLPLRDKRPERESVELKDAVPDYKPMSMKVEDFQNEARDAHDLLRIYSLIRARDATVTWNIKRRLLSEQGEASELDRRFLDKYQANAHSLLTRANDTRLSTFPKTHLVNRGRSAITATMPRLREFVTMIPVLAAQSALGEIVTERISNVQLRVGLQRGQGLTPSYQCPDLASALYLQFYLLITKNKAPRFCENPPCGELYFPAKRNQLYCSESCRSNARNYPKA
jgi:hypothetical protein